MKNFSTYINEKLVINKNLKTDYDLKFLSDIKFTPGWSSEILETETNIVEIFADYIRINAIKKFNNIASFIKANNSKNGCFVGINENTLEINIYRKKTSNSYEKIAIFGSTVAPKNEYNFNCYSNVSEDSIFPMRYDSTMNKAENPEYYEISMMLFEEIIECHTKISSSLNEKFK